MLLHKVQKSKSTKRDGIYVPTAGLVLINVILILFRVRICSSTMCRTMHHLLSIFLLYRNHLSKKYVRYSKLGLHNRLTLKRLIWFNSVRFRTFFEMLKIVFSDLQLVLIDFVPIFIFSSRKI